MGPAEYAPAEHKVNRGVSTIAGGVLQQNRHGLAPARASLTAPFSVGSAGGD